MISVRRVTRQWFVVVCALLTACDSFNVERIPTATQSIGPMALRIRLPDTVFVNDSALASAVVADSAGNRSLFVSYDWHIEPVTTAGLHGAENFTERWILGFRPGIARVRLRASSYVATGSVGGPTGTYTSGYTIQWGDTTHLVVVVGR